MAKHVRAELPQLRPPVLVHHVGPIQVGELLEGVHGDQDPPGVRLHSEAPNPRARQKSEGPAAEAGTRAGGW